MCPCISTPDMACPNGVGLSGADGLLIAEFFHGNILESRGKGLRRLATGLRGADGIERAKDGFFSCRAWFRNPHDSTRPGIFVAGCATGMKPIRNCMIDGSSVAARVMALLRQAKA